MTGAKCVSDNDKVKLLLQNARQLLKIVDASLSGTSLEERAANMERSHVNTDMDRLACDWKQASNMLEAEGGHTSDEITTQLNRVRLISVQTDI